MRVLDQSSPKRYLSWLGVALSSLNLAMVMAILRHGFEGSWGGFYVFLINLPISIPVLFIGHVVQPAFPWFAVLVGAIWWYVVGWWIENLIRRFRQRSENKAKSGLA